MVQGVTVSGGVTMWDGEENAGQLMERADAALYRAKDLGRDQVDFADLSPTTATAATSTA